MVAGFFNVFLPGGIGGDGVRLLMAAQTLNGPFSRVAASAAVDRILGLEALLIVAVLSCLRRLPTLTASPILNHLAQFVGLAAGGGLVSFLALLYLGDQTLVATLLARLGRLGRLGRFLVGLCESFPLYRRHPVMLCAALGMSLAAHLCMLTAFTLFAAPSGSNLTMWDYGFVLSITQAASCFAVVPGALGIAEALFGYLTALLAHGETPLGSLFLGFRVVIALATAPGALVWVGSPFRQRK
ncbi:MAG: lysylphosphatidylglycerol synthase domain-containing protein [Negativicutes bacterium]|nr:lysylphosphatidylglycerol synthase domain-containing protein [Negativicutes bacterium]